MVVWKTGFNLLSYLGYSFWGGSPLSAGVATCIFKP